MRKKPLKRKTGLKRTPIRKVSAKLSKELRRYYVLRKEFLKDNPTCWVMLEKCTQFSTQVHHRKRRGKHLNDRSTFVACCMNCHSFIEANGKWAREMGWLT